MSAEGTARPMSMPRNVRFITADQWRGDCLSALGRRCLKTPNLDRLPVWRGAVPDYSQTARGRLLSLHDVPEGQRRANCGMGYRDFRGV